MATAGFSLSSNGRENTSEMVAWPPFFHPGKGRVLHMIPGRRAWLPTFSTSSGLFCVPGYFDSSCAPTDGALIHVSCSIARSVLASTNYHLDIETMSGLLRLGTHLSEGRIFGQSKRTRREAAPSHRHHICAQGASQHSS